MSKITYKNNYVEVCCAGKRFAVNFGEYGLLTIGSSESDTFNTSGFVDGIKKKHIEFFVGNNGRAYINAKKGAFIDNNPVSDYPAKTDQPVVIKIKDEVVLTATLRSTVKPSEDKKPMKAVTEQNETKTIFSTESTATPTYETSQTFSSVPFGDSERYCKVCGSYVPDSESKCPFCKRSVRPGKIFSGLSFDFFNQGNKAIKKESIINIIFNPFTLFIALPLFIISLFLNAGDVSIVSGVIALFAIGHMVILMPRKVETKNIQTVYQIRAARVYEDGNIVMSPDRIFNKKTGEIITININEIIAAYDYSKLPHNILPDFNKIGIVLVDKSGKKTVIVTGHNSRTSKNDPGRIRTLAGIATVCPNAKTGRKKDIYKDALENAEIKDR